MNNAPEFSLHFTIYDSSISPTSISLMTGIIYAEAKSKGSRNKKLNLPRQDTWTIWSKAKSNDINVHWNDIKNELISSQDKLKDAAKTGRAVLSIYFTSPRLPPITLPHSLLAFLAYVNAEIDIDHQP